MAIDILNPIDLINALFGSLVLFWFFCMLLYFYIASKYKFNLQITLWLGVVMSFIFGILFDAWAVSYGFGVVGLGAFLSYIFWRYFR